MARIETRLNALEKRAPSISRGMPGRMFICETTRKKDDDSVCYCASCESWRAAKEMPTDGSIFLLCPVTV